MVITFLRDTFLETLADIGPFHESVDPEVAAARYKRAISMLTGADDSRRQPIEQQIADTEKRQLEHPTDRTLVQAGVRFVD